MNAFKVELFNIDFHHDGDTGKYVSIYKKVAEKSYPRLFVSSSLSPIALFLEGRKRQFSKEEAAKILSKSALFLFDK